MKLNKKGYMLVEIVIATVLAFSIAFYLLNLTYKFKNTNSDIQESRAFLADRLVITKNIMNDIRDKAVGNVWTRSYINNYYTVEDSEGNEKKVSKGNFIRFVLVYDECSSDGSCSQKREWRQLAVKLNDGIPTVYYGKGSLTGVSATITSGYCTSNSECADAFTYDTTHDSYFEKKLSSVLQVKDIIDSNKFVKVDGYKIKNVDKLSDVDEGWLDSFSSYYQTTDMEKIIDEIEGNNLLDNVANIRTSDYYYAILPIFSIYSDEDYGINIFAKRMYKLDFVRNIQFVENKENEYTELYSNVNNDPKKARAWRIAVNLTVDGEKKLMVSDFCKFYEAGTQFSVDSIVIRDSDGDGKEIVDGTVDGTKDGIPDDAEVIEINHTYRMNAETINQHGHGLWGGANSTVDDYRVVDHFFLRFYFKETSKNKFQYCGNSEVDCDPYYVDTKNPNNPYNDGDIGYLVNGNVRGNNRPCL